MKTIELYNAIFRALGLEVNDDFEVVYGQTNIEAQGRKLVLPVNDVLKQKLEYWTEDGGRVAFHPLVENTLKGESIIHHKLKDLITRFHLNALANFIVDLATLIQHKEAHEGLSPEQHKILSLAKDGIDDKTLTNVLKIFKGLDPDQDIAKVYVKRGGKHEGKEYSRLCTTTFSLGTEEDLKARKVMGVILRAKDLAFVKNFMAYMLPDYEQPGRYATGSSNEFCPTLDALLKNLVSIGKRYNEVIDLFAPVLPEDAKCLPFYMDLDSLALPEDDDEMEDWQHEIKMLDGNQGETPKEFLEKFDANGHRKPEAKETTKMSQSKDSEPEKTTAEQEAYHKELIAYAMKDFDQTSNSRSSRDWSSRRGGYDRGSDRARSTSRYDDRSYSRGSRYDDRSYSRGSRYDDRSYSRGSRYDDRSYSRGDSDRARPMSRYEDRSSDRWHNGESSGYTRRDEQARRSDREHRYSGSRYDDRSYSRGRSERYGGERSERRVSPYEGRNGDYRYEDRQERGGYDRRGDYGRSVDRRVDSYRAGNHESAYRQSLLNLNSDQYDQEDRYEDSERRYDRSSRYEDRRSDRGQKSYGNNRSDRQRGGHIPSLQERFEGRSRANGRWNDPRSTESRTDRGHRQATGGAASQNTGYASRQPVQRARAERENIQKLIDRPQPKATTMNAWIEETNRMLAEL